MGSDTRSTPFGPIPREWNLLRVGTAGAVQIGRARSPATDTGPNMVPYLRVANVLDGYIDYSDVNAMHFSEADQKKYTIREGDVLLNEGQSTELVGRSAIFEGPNEHYCFQNSLINFRCSPLVVPRFARAVFKRWLDIGHFTTIVKQTTSMAHLGGSRFANLEFPVPSLGEQRCIAEILDTLDDAIRKTEQLIEKLKQVKQGLLHDLLTRGIDDNGELRDPIRHPEEFRDSPHGRVPSAWGVTMLGDALLGIDAGWSPSCIETPPPLGAWGVLKVSAVSGGRYASSESKTLPSRLLPRPELEVFPGDVLLARANGVAELVGVTVEVDCTPPRLMLSDKLLRLRPDPRRLLPGFMARVMSYASTRRQIDAMLSGSSGQKNISQSFIRRVSIPLPSLEEQAILVNILRASDGRIRSEQRDLGKLQLLKQGLMEDLLTGRVRVTKLLEEART